MRYKNFMKKRMLSLLLTIVLLTTAYMPAYAESSKMLHDSFSSNEVKETGINIENLMIIEDNSVQEQRNVLEEELVPVASTNCVQNKVYARYAGYYCSYIPSAYYRYRLQHPDGYTIDISDPNMFYIGQNYMELVVAMENAEDNAEALTRMLGFGVTVAMVLHNPYPFLRMQIELHAMAVAVVIKAIDLHCILLCATVTVWRWSDWLGLWGFAHI